MSDTQTQAHARTGKLPVVRGVRTKAGDQVAVLCPYCHCKHLHGAVDAGRLSHCRGGSRGSYVVRCDPPPAEATEDQ